VDAAEYLQRRAERTRAERMRGYARVLEARADQTSPDRLAQLATDEIRAVRVWSARNRRCPANALDLLAHDDDDYVTWNVLSNPCLPESRLRFLAEEEAALDYARNRPDRRPWTVVRSSVLRHPNAGRQLRRELRKAGVD
jgi:hypothetical protein